MWAKFSKKEPGRFHSLLHHSLDVAAVSLDLLNRSSFRGKSKIWRHAFPSLESKQSDRLLAFLCALHDLGKATPYFQEKNLTLKSQQVKEGFIYIPLSLDKSINRHDAFTQKLLIEETSDSFATIFDGLTCEVISNALGGHHGEYIKDMVLRKITRKVLGDAEIWKTARQDLISELILTLDIQFPLQRLSLDSTVPTLVFQYWLTGFLTLADWIASMEEYFPYESSIEKMHTWSSIDYFSLAQKRAKKALDIIGFSTYKIPEHAPHFITAFPGLSARVQQVEILNFVAQSEMQKEPSILIVEAPTGMGKSEVAFLLSELLIRRQGLTGAYIAMPTQATSNQMYQRYRTFLREVLPHDFSGSFELLHSASDMFLATAKSSPEIEALSMEEESLLYPKLEAQAWFSAKKRGLLAQYAVGTIDQALLAILRSKHHYLRLFGLGAKVLVFDEVHSYDIYMSQLLFHLLRWAGMLDISIIILSATLPKKKRDELITAYTGKNAPPDAAYPRLVLGTSQNITAHALTTPPEKMVLFEELSDATPESLLAELKRRLKDGGCAAVICNTVSLAQSLYVEFCKLEGCDKNTVVLLHARFPADKRMEIENRVISALSKTGARPEAMIVFTTQIIEQSLDLDFDFIFSELCPIDLMLQRAGRLHRFSSTIRPQDGLVPRFCWFNFNADKLKKGEFFNTPYSLYILYRSFIAIGSRKLVNVSSDVDQLIEQVYGDMSSVPENNYCADVLLRLEKEFLERQLAAETKAIAKLIPAPDISEDDFFNDFELLDEEDPENNEKIVAGTRLGPRSVKVVCLLRKDDTYVLANNNFDPFPAEPKLDDASVRKILSASLSLTGEENCKKVLSSKDTEPPEEWKKNGHLRYVRILRFNSGCCECAGKVIYYSDELGIFYHHI